MSLKHSSLIPDSLILVEGKVRKAGKNKGIPRNGSSEA